MPLKYLSKTGQVTEEFKQQFPDLYKAVYDEGYQDGQNSVNFHVDETHLDLIEDGAINPTITTKMTVEERAKKTWDNDAQIQNEFCGDYESYLAWFKADARGLVKIIGA